MRLRKDYYARHAWDTPEHQAQRAAWAHEQAARERAQADDDQPTGLVALHAEFDAATGTSMTQYAEVKSSAQARAAEQAYQIVIPDCPPREAGVAGIAEWASRVRLIQAANRRAIYAAMAEDPAFVGAEASKRSRQAYIYRAANRDCTRDWMTPAEAAADRDRLGD